MPNEWLTTRAVAERLGVDVATVARWVRTGLLTPDIKTPGLRGAYVFSPETVDAFAAAREDKSA